MESHIKSEHVNFLYDSKAQICYIKWVGDVPTKDFKEAILLGKKLIENSSGMTSILLDRHELGEFTPESRVWLKQDFMRNEGRVLIKKVKKLAAVKPSTGLAVVMTTVFSAIFQIANPNLEYQVFENAQDAMQWIREEGNAEGKSFMKRIFGMFKSNQELVKQG